MARLRAFLASLFESREHWLKRMMEEPPPQDDAVECLTCNGA